METVSSVLSVSIQCQNYCVLVRTPWVGEWVKLFYISSWSEGQYCSDTVRGKQLTRSVC